MQVFQKLSQEYSPARIQVRWFMVEVPSLLNHSLGSEWGVPANKANNYAQRKFQVRKFTFKMTPIDKLRCVFLLSADAFCSKVSHTSLKGKNVSCKSHLAIFQSAHPNKKAIVITRAAQNNAPFRFWLAWELVAVGDKLMWECSVTDCKICIFVVGQPWHGAIEFASPIIRTVDRKWALRLMSLLFCVSHTKFWCNTYLTPSAKVRAYELWEFCEMMHVCTV